MIGVSQGDCQNAPTMSEVCDIPIAIMSSNLSQLHPTFLSVNED